MQNNLLPFSDRLQERIESLGAPICVGIDPMPNSLPPLIRQQIAENNDEPEAIVDAIFDFCAAALKIVAPLAPIVKFQSAYFEEHLWEGVESYYSLVQQAKSLGLLVIGDVKRGDIGSTSAAYARAHLEDRADEQLILPDAITVNPLLGLDTLTPFIDKAKSLQKGLFVLVRTSNPGSADFQDVHLADGRTWSEMVAEKLQPLASGWIGNSGLSGLGAVVGATQPHTMQRLRERLPQSIFLLPGYGAQGATADMTRAAFIAGRGAIVSASRSILYAFDQPRYASQFGHNWEKCIEQATIDMVQDVKRVIGS